VLSLPCSQLHETVWAQLAALAEGIVGDADFPARNQQYATSLEEADDGEGSGGRGGAGLHFEDCLRVLRGIALCGRRYLEEVVLPQTKRTGAGEHGDDAAAAALAGAGSPGAPVDFAPSFLTATAWLHNAIYFLAGSLGTSAQADIVCLCEAVWLAGLEGCEAVVPALVPYILVRSLQPDTARDADVRRVHTMRHALALLDVEDESFSSIREFVLLAYRSPVYLRVSEGRRFLSFVLCLHPSLVADIHGVVKVRTCVLRAFILVAVWPQGRGVPGRSAARPRCAVDCEQACVCVCACACSCSRWQSNLPGAPARVVEAYGEVYFRAWRCAEGATLLRIEQVCLQDLMYCGVHASVPSTFKACRGMIDAWVSQKKQRGVDDVLLRCYGPILWRSLEVANPDVRRFVWGGRGLSGLCAWAPGVRNFLPCSAGVCVGGGRGEGRGRGAVSLRAVPQRAPCRLTLAHGRTELPLRHGMRVVQPSGLSCDVCVCPALSAVRRNAAILFLDAFPLQLSDAGQEDSEALWHKQFTALFSLLNDSCPAVRLAAAQGTCRLLAGYWEVVPASTAKDLLLKLVEELVWCPAPVPSPPRSAGRILQCPSWPALSSSTSLRCNQVDAGCGDVWWCGVRPTMAPARRSGARCWRV
jgi:hypothetical protein